jgi:glycosyltransferase involved in cell wall biosynthesis
MGVKAGSVITPLVLTYNEAPNIGRTLESLRWAERVIVLDSGSTDATEELARSFPNVDWRFRPFDSFKAQTEYGVHQTEIETDYVLALDADMSLGPAVVEEIDTGFLSGKFAGGLFAFQYCIAGQPLTGSLYPAQIRLFRRDLIQVEQVGHGHKFDLSGSIYQFKARLLHDDRKSLERWVAAQLSYSAQELQRIHNAPQPGWRDWLRQSGVMPWLIGPYAYFKAGGPLRGAAAARYAYERVTFECLLALRWLTERLERQGDAKD